jgi:hypothetical protein
MADHEERFILALLETSAHVVSAPLSHIDSAPLDDNTLTHTFAFEGHEPFELVLVSNIKEEIVGVLGRKATSTTFWSSDGWALESEAGRRALLLHICEDLGIEPLSLGQATLATADDLRRRKP